MSTVRIEPIKPHIGGIVHTDKEHLLDDQTIVAVREALEHCGVLVFPRMNLTDSEQLASPTSSVSGSTTIRRPGQWCGRRGRRVHHHPRQENQYPARICAGYLLLAHRWRDDQPAAAKATLLSARKLSPTGGQTEFASTYAAYENLPEAEKKALDPLKVIHRMEASMRPVFEVMSERISLAGAVCRKSWCIRSSGNTARVGSRW